MINENDLVGTLGRTQEKDDLLTLSIKKRMGQDQNMLQDDLNACIRTLLPSKNLLAL